MSDPTTYPAFGPLACAYTTPLPHPQDLLLIGEECSRLWAWLEAASEGAQDTDDAVRAAFDEFIYRASELLPVPTPDAAAFARRVGETAAAFLGGQPLDKGSFFGAYVLALRSQRAS